MSALQTTRLKMTTDCLSSIQYTSTCSDSIDSLLQGTCHDWSVGLSLSQIVSFISTREASWTSINKMHVWQAMADSWNCDSQKSLKFALKSPMTNLRLSPFGPYSLDFVQHPKFSCLPGPLLKNLNHNLPECHCLGISGRLYQHSTQGKLGTAKLLTDWQTYKGMTLSFKNQPVEKLLWYIDLQKTTRKNLISQFD